jgi:type II secretory pathway component PulF
MLDPAVQVILVGCGLMVLGVALQAATHILEPNEGNSDTLDSLLSGLRLISWVLIVIGFLAGVGPFLGVVGFFVLIWAGGYALYHSVRRRQDALLGVLAVSVERGVPLGQAVEAFAREQGTRGRRLRRFALLLGAGESLPDALEAVRGLLSRRAMLRGRVGSPANMLAPALRAAQTVGRSSGAIWFQVSSRLAYLVNVILFSLLVLLFIMVKIAPAFVKIFQDYDAELPIWTQTIIGAANTARLMGGVCIVPLLVMMGAFLLFFRYLDLLPFSPPLLGRLTRRWHAAAILEALALVVRGGQPLPPALATVAASYPRWPIRRRMARVADRVAEGKPWHEALVAGGLLSRAELVLLQTAERAGNLAWVLDEVADGCRRRLYFRLNALIQVAFPLVILAFGLIVAAAVIGFFMPLISLVQKLS